MLAKSLKFLFCVKCGHKNTVTDRFCKNCGREINESPD
ncbi:zinc-ribbon domain-containing protein [Promethearchaeum syntrophicum]|uniref:Zinc-ribbon domain-containing protein n=1 Tax=Promethearchaeum syntrophicum TaxID=2594042 RepID=A0AC61ZTZ8_9ARCH